MLTRGLRVATVALLLVAGASWLVDARPPRHSTTERISDVAQVAAVAAGKRGARCDGLKRGAVRGAEPEYTRKKLAKFRNHKRLCHGIWLPEPRRHLVPQGLAVSGRTAWISGYRHREGYGKRPCQLVRVHLSTGRRLAFHRAIYGQVGKRPRTYCRHGGGIVQRGRWLWIVEKNKLWLVEPAQRGSVIEARRVWRLRTPVRGSAVVAGARRIGLVPFQTSGKPRIHWFSLGRLFKPGVLDLGVRDRGRKQLGAYARTRVPTYVQGAALDARGRLYVARSNLACGELVTPWGRRVGFVPGAEGIQFAAGGRRLWAVSESGARPYAISRKPFTPAVASFEWPHLRRGKPAGCRFRAY